MNYQNYLGYWKNTNKHSKGVKAFEFFEKEGVLWVTITGVETGLVAGKWGTTICKPYAATTNSKTPIAFHSTYESYDFDAAMQFNVNKGLIILAIIIDFKTTTKSGVFIREFFHRQK